MKTTTARYLLRFDDLCPTMDAGRWWQFEELIEEFRLRPILAVVPENQDKELEVSPPDPQFWEHMRACEAAGAAIGLHGYRHICSSHRRSLLGLSGLSEFAGVDIGTQRAWIAEGLRILRGHGLNPRVWVAPRHGFDRQTLSALLDEGIAIVSDGFTNAPRLRCGLTWIPQQLWAPVEKQSGIWTICLHPNTARDAEIETLRRFLFEHFDQFTTVDEAICHSPLRALGPIERVHTDAALWRFKLSRAARRARHGWPFQRSRSS